MSNLFSRSNSLSIGLLGISIMLIIKDVGKEAACAGTIRTELEAMRKEKVATGSVHKTLYRLLEKGLLSEHKGEPEKKQGGKAKVYYTVTDLGDYTLYRLIEPLVEIAKKVL